MDDVGLITSGCTCWLNMPVPLLEVTLLSYCKCEAHKKWADLALTAENIWAGERRRQMCDKTIIHYFSKSAPLLMMTTCKPWIETVFYWQYSVQKKRGGGRQGKRCAVFLKEKGFRLTHRLQPSKWKYKWYERGRLLYEWNISYKDFLLIHLEVVKFLIFTGFQACCYLFRTRLTGPCHLNPSRYCLNTGQVHFQEVDFSISNKLWLSELSSCSNYNSAFPS